MKIIFHPEKYYFISWIYRMNVIQIENIFNLVCFYYLSGYPFAFPLGLQPAATHDVLWEIGILFFINQILDYQKRTRD